MKKSVYKLFCHLLLVIGFSTFVVNITKGQELALVPNNGNATVSVIDVSTQSVIDMLNVGGGPIAVAWHPSGRRIYVCNRLGQSISVFNFDGSVFAPLHTFNVGFASYGLSVKPDGTELWVADDSNGEIKVYNASDPFNLITTIGFPGTFNAWSVEFTPDGTKAIATSPFTSPGDIVFINTSTYDPNFVTSSIPLGGLGSAISRDGSRYAVVGGGMPVTDPGVLEIFDVNTEASITTIPIGIQPSSVVWSLDDSRIYVANFSSNSISVINANTNLVVNTITTNGSEPNGLDISSDGNFLFVPLSGSNIVEVFSTVSESSIGEIMVGSIPVNIGRFIFRIHPIPTLSQWGWIALSLLVGILGILQLKYYATKKIKAT